MSDFEDVVAHGGLGGDDETFQDQLRQSLKSAPWLVISIAFHVVLILVLRNVNWMTRTFKEDLVIQAEAIVEDTEVVEPPPPPPPEPPEEVEPVEEDPVVSEDEVEQFVEEQENRSPIDSPFDSRNLNNVIGAGGGAGGGFGGKYGRRGGRGGGKADQKAVDAGLDWLFRHQEPEGFWDCDDFGRHCTSPLNDGKGNALHDVGITALSLLAFMGAGNTSEAGQYKETVKNGLRWLGREQDREDGCFGSKNGHHFIYSHSLATLAMIEGYHLSGVPLFKRPAQKGLEFISRSRNPYKAWRYDYPPAGDNDVSITGWMLFALFAGRDAGLQVDDSAIKDGMAYIEEMTDPATGRTGYHERGSYPAREQDDMDRWPGELSESMTAVANLVRVFNKEDPDSSPTLKAGADLMIRQLPKWDESKGTIDFYYWYYGSYAMWQMSGKYWDKWQKAMLESVVKNQRTGTGCERGSWDPQVDPWGDDGGRVYSTAINVLCLEVYYRYDKVFGAR